MTLATLSPSALLTACGSRAASTVRWASAANDDAGGTGLVWADPSSGEAFRIATEFRGHGLAAHPQRPWEVTLFTRRPGQTCAVLDLREGRVVHAFDATDDRAFQGHGFYTADGSRLVTSEAHVETAEGWLGVRETAGYGLIDAMPTSGLGPHEILPMPDGDTVVVANGGLLTRPETGREVLNLDTMDSSLAYLSLSTGAVHEAHRVDVPKGSIRHLDVAASGLVAFGIQVQREPVDYDDVLPLGGWHRPGESPRLFDDGLDAVAAMDDYVGSVALDPESSIVGMTSPRGNVALFWNLESGAYMGLHELVDCSGIAAAGSRFMLSSSVGEVRVLEAADLTEVSGARRRFQDVHWDNHFAVIDMENAR
ncbi:MAG: DUF1513 domain-containing protein [Sandaracinaceae bacterium]